jgi:methyl-accepting chemotaxis protein
MVQLLRRSFAAKLLVGFALTTGAVVGYGLVTRNVVGTMLMATAGQVVLGAYLGTNTVVSMRTVEDQTESIADGDLDVPVRTSRADELGRVYSSVDRMRRSLATWTDDADEARAEAETAEEARSAAGDAIETMGDVDETMSEAVDRIETLDAATAEITEAAERIRDIAEQTNMLALYASIEAARAGGDADDAGFGLVSTLGTAMLIAFLDVAAKVPYTWVVYEHRGVFSETQLAERAGAGGDEEAAGLPSDATAPEDPVATAD